MVCGADVKEERDSDNTLNLSAIDTALSISAKNPFSPLLLVFTPISFRPLFTSENHPLSFLALFSL